METAYMNIRCFISIVIFVLLANRSEAQIYGCTDRLAKNYNQSATVNDGSCKYNPANIAPLGSLKLDNVLSETSGLILWNNLLWTHNDNADTNIYSLDTLYGSIVRSYPLNKITNTDWEEISQDDDYIYIGDFGNNSGNRKDLKIYRAAKNSILNNSALFDSICFSYSDQTDYTPDVNETDFDCEAFFVSEDSIFLFTKQWVSKETRIYSLPKEPGNHIAKSRSSLDVNGLITGVVYLEEKKIIVLSGYSKMLDPFFFLLYDFRGTDFFEGNKRKIEVLLPYHQIEGITTADGIKYYVTNEYFSMDLLGTTPQKIHVFNLSSFLGNYLNLPILYPDTLNNFIISPVPVHDILAIKSLSELLPVEYFLINLSGQIVLTGSLTSENSIVNVTGLAAGMYFLRIGEEKRHSYKVIKE
jgi:hypothetical protein